ncbi:MAG: Snf7 family protein [Nitrosarchaeum sp.]|jgi:division protein CdvB (Snf7/Vps24/ESCRT-III family)|nr:Snf7 family protein [Nitrosarchaeum sp.]MBP0120481.1 Snf7 family protein [Nitrosarchaeum sp.]MBP0134347.1 Snf7 family protein [Nitrosarchaeum sp.]
MQQNWNNPQSKGLSDHLHSLKKEAALKPQIQNSLVQLNKTVSSLDYKVKGLEDKDAKLFNRIVLAKKTHDLTTAKVLANELVEIRKNKKVLSTLKISLEQINLRLSTVQDLGDAMVSLRPIMATMHALQPSLGRIMPEVSREFESLFGILNESVSSSFEGSFESDGASNAETESILKEAAAVAGTRVGEKFPSTPTGISSSSSIGLE